MAARKIVIHGCGDCPRSDHKGAFGAVSRIPVCRKADRELPWTPSASSAGFVSAKREPGIPNWCPLPADAPAAAEIQPERAGATQPVAVSLAFTLLDAREFPPPKGKKILCGSAVRFGTTVIGLFDPNGHDCWSPMPGFPASLKKMR